MTDCWAIGPSDDALEYIESVNTIEPLVVVAFNVSGTGAAAAEYISAVAAAQGASIAVISETKFANSMAIRDFAAATGARVFTRDAPAGVDYSSAQYGVAVIVFDAALKIDHVDEDANGMIAVSVRRPSSRPVLLVGAYLPPAQSEVKGRRALVIDRIAGVIRREAHKYSACVVAGDLNSVIGSHGQRNSPQQPLNARYVIDKLLTPLGMSPVAGRHWTADLTSPKIAETRGTIPIPRTEVDFIITETGTPAVALPTIAFEPERGYHRPIGAVISLEEATSEDAEPPPKRPRAARPPRYKSPYWTDSFASINAGWDQIGAAAQAGASIDALYGMLTTLLTVSRDHPTAPLTEVARFRQYEGQKLPAEAVTLLQRARMTRALAAQQINIRRRAALCARAEAEKREGLRIAAAAVRQGRKRSCNGWTPTVLRTPVDSCTTFARLQQAAEGQAQRDQPLNHAPINTGTHS